MTPRAENRDGAGVGPGRLMALCRDRLTALLRPSAFGQSSAGRSSDRYRRASLTAFTSVVARGLSFVATLVTVPLAVRYLGAERFGMWMTISSIIALLGFADLGIGNGLLNAIARAHGKDDMNEAGRKVSSALVMLTSVAVLLGVGFAVAYPLVRWDRVFAVTSPLARSEAGPAIAVFAVCFLVGLPLSVAAQVRTGRQEGYVVHIMTGLANVLGVGLLVVAMVGGYGTPGLVLAFAGPPVLAATVNWALVFGRRYRWLRPSLRRADFRSAVALLRVGSLFFVLQVAVALAFTSDTIVVAQVVGPIGVAEYAVTAKLFMLPTLIGVVFGALWPAYGEAVARGDLPWVRKTLRRSIWFGVAVYLPSAIILTVGGRFLIHLWVGNAIRPPLLLIAGFAFWLVLSGLGGAAAIFLNGVQEIFAQAASGIVMAVANILLSIWLARRIGVAGVMWGTVISYTLFTLIPMAYFVPRALRRVEQEESVSEMPSTVVSAQSEGNW